MEIIKKSIFGILTLLTLHQHWATCKVPDNIDVLDEWWTTFSESWPRYHQTTQIIHQMAETLPKNVQIYSIGKTVQKREMWVIKLGSDLTKKRSFLVPQMKLVANMHGDETLGRALLLMFAVDVLTKYQKGYRR